MSSYGMPFRVLVILGLALGLLRLGASTAKPVRRLSFEDRVEAQRAIEEVYWRHRLWPDANPGEKPPLEELLPRSAMEDRVEDYLAKSIALERIWARPVLREQLQAELDRMASGTRDPGMLRELFVALNDDPLLVAECLARPALVDRLIRNWYATDHRFHGELRARAERELSRFTNAEQMDRLSGEYTEEEIVRAAETGDTTEPSRHPRTTVLDAAEWLDLLQSLVVDPKARWSPQVGRAIDDRLDAPVTSSEELLARIPVGRPLGLHEEPTRFVTRAVLEKHEDRLKLAVVQWRKQPFEEWWRELRLELGLSRDDVESRFARREAAAAELPQPGNAARLPETTGVPCAPADSWTSIFGRFPSARAQHTAVWTGSEMIVWGGTNQPNASLLSLNTGGRYVPATDSWTGTSMVDVPGVRWGHTTVWTGQEMIVWGGTNNDGSTVATGGRYDPLTDRWTPMSTAGAPSARRGHTSVWTGGEMIVWGGTAPGPVHTGGRYDPTADSWRQVSTVSAPIRRFHHTAVWTGDEMIVWGGYGGDPLDTVATGGRYDPATNGWSATSTSDAPEHRGSHTAVWTGDEMIVWGGFHGNPGSGVSTGGRYDPLTDQWAPTSTVGAPTAGASHTAVWTGDEMIVWGGWGDPTGSRYDPLTNGWTPMSTAGAPMDREEHTAVWTGSEMIVWGGYGGDHIGTFFTGGRYDPSMDQWVPTSTENAPRGRRDHEAVWTGSEMIIWGVEDGSRYDPALDQWTPTSTTNAPPASPGLDQTTVWTGSEMIVWIGWLRPSDTSGGSRYDPTLDSWAPVTTANAPGYREYHTAIWTGSEMIIWGGERWDSQASTVESLTTGGRYNPTTDSWTPTSTATVSTGRHAHAAVWTGGEMIVWGGSIWDGFSVIDLATGDRYDPGLNRWTPTSMENAPSARDHFTAVWTGDEMIVWGGFAAGFGVDTGARYVPSTDSWIPTTTTNAPTARSRHSAVWTGSEMIVWSGIGGPPLGPGGRYDPLTDGWNPMSTANAPIDRSSHTAVWTGSEMIVWGGASYLDTGGRYCACSAELCDGQDNDCDGAVDEDFDNDDDGLTTCGLDCDDANPYCGTDCTDLDADGYCVDFDCDESNPGCGDDCTDSDGDGYCQGIDCDETTIACTDNCTIVWDTYGGVGRESLNSAIETSDGGIIAVGRTTSFGAGGDDAWAIKLNTLGRIEWEKSYGGTGTDYAHAVDQTTDGGYIVVGERQPDSWVLKLNAAGDVEWTRQLGASPGYQRATDVRQTTDGGYIVAAYSSALGAGEEDMWLVKLDGSGAIDWQRTYGGAGEDLAFAVDQTTDDGFIVAGITDSFGAGEDDAWLLKLDSAGQIEWQETIGGSATDWLRDVVHTSDGGYAIAGFSRSFGGNRQNYWIAKLGSTGGVQWQKYYDAPGTQEEAMAIRQTPDDGYIVGGGVNSRSFLYWVLKLDWVGTIQWQKFFGGASHDWSAKAVEPLAGGGYLVAGSAHSFGAGDSDFWILRVDDNGDVSPCAYTEDTASSGQFGDAVAQPSAAVVGTPTVALETPSILVTSTTAEVGWQCGAGAANDPDQDRVPSCADNCYDTPNPDQADVDADGAGDVCDTCELDYNPAQTDSDDDMEGDLCDVNDGVIYFLIEQKERIDWQDEAGFDVWNCYQGDLLALRSGGGYTQDPASFELAARHCDLAEPWIESTDPLSPGQGLFFLATGEVNGVESGLGTDSSGEPRPNERPCP